MAQEVAYPPEDVTKALIALVLARGDVDAVAEQVIDERFMVPRETLWLWMNETHAEQYKRLEREHGELRERMAVEQLRGDIAELGGWKRDMAERVKDIRDDRLTPSALRALADAEAKSVHALLALTGRPTDGKRGEGSMEKVVSKLVDAGLLSLAPGAALPQQVENEAEVVVEAEEVPPPPPPPVSR